MVEAHDQNAAEYNKQVEIISVMIAGTIGIEEQLIRYHSCLDYYQQSMIFAVLGVDLDGKFGFYRIVDFPFKM